MLAQKVKPDVSSVPGVDNAAQTVQKRKDEEMAAKKQRADDYIKEHTFGNVEIPEINGTAGLPSTGIEKTAEPKTGFLDTLKNKANDFVNKQAQKATTKSAPPSVTAESGATLEKADELGKAANQTIQNAEIPKWKRMTINDVLFNPEYEGIRDSIASQAVNARGANFLKGLAGKDGNYTSAIDQYNNQQAQRYSDAVADRDTRALEAQLQADEAANKRDVGAELQREDTYLGRELDRWGLLYDTETKKQVLDRMIGDSKLFAEQMPNPEDRLILTAYQQYLSGDATALDSIISVYGPEILEKVPSLLNKAGSFFGGDEGKSYPDVTIGGVTYTAEQLENLGADRIDKLLQELPVEEQDAVISELEKNYGGSDVKKLRRYYDNRIKEDEYKDEQVKQSDERAKTFTQDITDIVNSYSGKDRERKLQDMINELDRDMTRGNIVETDNIKTARAKAEKELALAKLANTVTGINKPLQNNVKLDISDKKGLNAKTTNSSLDYLSTVDWEDLIEKNTGSVTDRKQKISAVRGTDGYQTVYKFLSNPNVKAYVSNSKNKEAREKYIAAVDNFLNTFDGNAKLYGFYDFGTQE